MHEVQPKLPVLTFSTTHFVLIELFYNFRDGLKHYYRLEFQFEAIFIDDNESYAGLKKKTLFHKLFAQKSHCVKCYKTFNI